MDWQNPRVHDSGQSSDMHFLANSGINLTRQIYYTLSMEKSLIYNRKMFGQISNSCTYIAIYVHIFLCNLLMEIMWLQEYKMFKYICM